MPDTTTMPHHQDRTAPPSGHTADRRPASAGRAPRPLTPEAREALALAVAATDLVRDARHEMSVHADDRRRAVLQAVRAGASYRRVAHELGVSTGNVQSLARIAASKEAAS